MNYFHVSFVTVKSLFFCSEIERKINTSSVKGNGEDEIDTIFFKK